ncbi:unnamed protein product [Moneuplotes crassus]|uniref:RING-type domain-containing protein n=1 Tax=Euplotes crassus TaxID=5936 RepID=A0AAD2D760_EUPCR|nr:unnamed protein product [Moneuplotes crassus]
MKTLSPKLRLSRQVDCVIPGLIEIIKIQSLQKNKSFLIMNPNRSQIGHGHHQRKRRFRSKLSEISLPADGEYLGVRGLLNRKKKNKYYESDNNTSRLRATLDHNEIAFGLDLKKGLLEPYLTKIRSSEETLLKFLCDYCEGLPNWINKPISLACGHNICAHCFRMYINEEFNESRVKIYYTCRSCMIEQNIFLSKDLINFPKLTQIYRYCPLEAMRFERYFNATLNEGFVEYIYTIKSRVDELESSSNSLQSQIEIYAKRAHQDTLFYKNRIMSFGAQTENHKVQYDREIMKDNELISELHCPRCGIDYKDKVFNFKFQCSQCTKELCLGKNAYAQNQAFQDSEEESLLEDSVVNCVICQGPPYYASCSIPIERRKRISTRRAKKLYVERNKGKKLRLILNEDPRKAENEQKNSKALTGIFKRFKHLIKEQIEEKKEERAAKEPKTCKECSGLFTMMNMAYKLVKCNHIICSECMKTALEDDSQENCYSLKCIVCKQDDQTKIKITHSKLEEVKDPKSLILLKIAQGGYSEYVIENKESVDHNINEFRELVIREDNIIMEEKGKKRDFCPKCMKKYDFHNPPHALRCCHRLCRDCIRELYDENAPKIKIKCAVDEKEHEYPKPADLIENEENKERFDNFNAFIEITIPVDFELFNEIFYGDIAFGDEEELQIREVYVQGEGKFTEKLRSGTIVSMKKSAGLSTSLNREKFIEQLKYDCECPICLMFYTRENPPLIYHCRNHSYKICKESMAMFLKMAAKKNENLTIDCPICDNVLEFNTLNRSLEDCLEDFEEDTDLLDKVDKYPELKKMIEDDYKNF